MELYSEVEIILCRDGHTLAFRKGLSIVAWLSLFFRQAFVFFVVLAALTAFASLRL